MEMVDVVVHGLQYIGEDAAAPMANMPHKRWRRRLSVGAVRTGVQGRRHGAHGGSAAVQIQDGKKFFRPKQRKGGQIHLPNTKSMDWNQQKVTRNNKLQEIGMAILCGEFLNLGKNKQN
jgi:hypothetical protein